MYTCCIFWDLYINFKIDFLFFCMANINNYKEHTFELIRAKKKTMKFLNI